MSLFRDFLEVRAPTLTRLSSKCHNCFFIWTLLSLEKYVRQKYSLCLFSKNLSVSHNFSLPFQEIEFILPKIPYIGGTDKLKKNVFNEKFEFFRCLFIHWLY